MKKQIERTSQKMFIKKKHGIYARVLKRGIDFVLSFVAILILSPLLLILTIVGTFAMRGNPFFIQERPGKNETIFKLIKFRTMTNKKNKHGILLPDEQRLTTYGKLLRSTSLDELPELWNVLNGTCSLVGPRPLLPSYLPRYNDYQKHRHDVRPGLTGYAQVHGRNSLSWEERFDMDVEYVNHITFLGDMKIIFQTVLIVLKREGISSETSATMEEFMGTKKK